MISFLQLPKINIEYQPDESNAPRSGSAPLPHQGWANVSRVSTFKTHGSRRKISMTPNSLQSSRQNWQRFKSLWGVRLRRTLNEFHCLQTSVPGTCYHPPQWVTIPCLFISDVPQKYTGPTFWPVYFSVLCQQVTVLYWYLCSNVS